MILINKVFADPLFQAKRIVNTKTITVLPKSYEHYLAQSFQWCCEVCDLLRADRQEGEANPPFCTHYFSIQIMDTFNHLGASLSQMTEELRKSCLNFEDETREFKVLYDLIERNYPNRDLSTKKSYFQALTQKQFFPYALLSNLKRLKDPQLPPKEEWYDPLKREYTSEANIAYANRVFALFECKSIMDYLRIYLEADVGKKCG